MPTPLSLTRDGYADIGITVRYVLSQGVCACPILEQE